VAWEAMPIRPPSRAASATRRPWPSSPSTAVAGTSQSSNVRETVLEERSPIFSSCRPTESPGLPPSTRKAVMPRLPAPMSVRAQTMITPARSPLVIHCFVPFSTQRSPRRSARVVMELGSLPAWGSERPNAPASHSPDARRGMQRAFCSGVPKRAMVSPTMLVTARVTESEQSARAISITAIA
jgi:hypothetical protein